MGLDTTHDCWHGPYSAFMRWRRAVAQAAGLPPLELMEGFFERGDYRDPIRDYAATCPELAEHLYASLPIRWEALRPNPLHALLSHSDCDGSISAAECGPMADALEAVLPGLAEIAIRDPSIHRATYDGIRAATERFIAGLRRASAAGEYVEFR